MEYPVVLKQAEPMEFSHSENVLFGNCKSADFLLLLTLMDF